MRLLLTIGLLSGALGWISCAEPHAPLAANAQAPASVRAAVSADPIVSAPLANLLSVMQAESPGCRLKVEPLGQDHTRVHLEDRDDASRARAAAGPPRQVPTAQWFYAQPFVDEGVIDKSWARAQARLAACMADAGPGPQRKGRDMHVEVCRIELYDDEVVPSRYHYGRALTIDLPTYFSVPGACDKAGSFLQTYLSAYGSP